MADAKIQGGVSENSRHLKPFYIMAAVGCVVIVALVGVIIALVMNLNNPTEPPEEEDDSQRRSVVVTEDNLDEVTREIADATPVQVGYYEARMTTVWNFPDGASPSPDAYVENVSNNTNDVYFDVELADTGEIIYESGVIPLGGHLNRIVLDTDLDPGSYNAVVVYHLIDENQKTLGTLRMAITINVES